MNIVAKVLCVFSHHGSVLLLSGKDPTHGNRYLRPLGGSIEFGERSSDTVVREIREELGAEIQDLRLLGVVESLFEFLGRRHHEILFVYDAGFQDRAMYDRPFVQGIEADGSDIVAQWYPVHDLPSVGIEVVPEGLLSLIALI